MRKMFRGIVERFSRSLAELIRGYDFDLPHQLRVKAMDEAIEFYHENMPNAQVFHRKKPMLDFELDNVKLSGLYLEFGVATAVHTNYIAKKIEHTIHGFDSFRGFPESYAGTLRSFHDYNGIKPKVRENVILHDGWFNETLPKFAKSNDENIAYLNIDCDLYSSTKTVFDWLGDRIQIGTIIHFDELIAIPGWREHEYKAFMEFVKNHNVKFEYLAVGQKGMVAVKITGISS